MVTVKMSTADMFGLAPLQVWDKVVINYVALWLLLKCMMDKVIDCKYCVRHNKKILKYFSRSSSATSESIFKIVCNCIRELFNVFGDPAQSYIL